MAQRPRFGDARHFLVWRWRPARASWAWVYAAVPADHATITAWPGGEVIRVVARRERGRAIWQELWALERDLWPRGITTMAMSLLDIALWDALGKRANLPCIGCGGHFRLADCRLTAAAASAARAATA